MIFLFAAMPIVAHCLAIDGDTLTCIKQGSVRVHVRLNGIDAPELPGHCRTPRVCAPGDPFASKSNLRALVRGQPVTWRSLGRDKYGRTIAQPKARGVDLSCAQLRGGFAIYVKRWDNRHTLAHRCPGLAK